MKRVVLVGIGKKSRSDDAAGLEVAAILDGEFETVRIDSDPLDYINTLCGSDVVVIVKAADLKTRPGEFKILEETEIDANLPISTFVNELKRCVRKVTVWGIQVKSVDPGNSVTPEVNDGIEKLAKTIKGMYGFYMSLRG